MQRHARRAHTVIILAVTAVALSACPVGPAGPGPSASLAPKVGRPGWIPSPNRSHPDKLYVTGSCRDQPSVRAARTCAIADAAKQLQKQLGASMAITVKGQFVENEYNERRRVTSGLVIDGWVLVAYPRRQLAKAETRVANRAMLGLACNAAAIGACESDALEAQILAAMSKAGLHAAPGKRLRGADAQDGKLAISMAEKAHAAKVLTVVITPKFLGSEDGEFYANARCDFRLIDAISGKVLTSRAYGPVKGGHLSKVKALKKAIDNCMKKLLPGISGLSS